MICAHTWGGGTSVFDLSNPKDVKSYTPKTPAYSSAQISRDLSFGLYHRFRDRSIQRWDFGPNDATKTWDLALNCKHSTLSPDDRQLATAGWVPASVVAGQFFAELILWQMTDDLPRETFRIRLPFHCPTKDIPLRIRYTPDGRSLVIWDSEQRLTVWDIATQKSTHEWNLPAGCDLHDISPDSRHLAFGSSLGAASIVRLEALQPPP